MDTENETAGPSRGQHELTDSITNQPPPPYTGPSASSHSESGFLRSSNFGEFQMPLNQMALPPYNFGMEMQAIPFSNQAGGVGESILAAQAVNAAISQNGRNPVIVVCPTCKNTAVTQLTEVENRNIRQGVSQKVYACYGMAAVVFIVFFILLTLIGETFIPLAVMPVFLIVFLVGFFVMSKANSTAARMCTDIQHRCSVCKTLLGVSSGTQLMHQMQMRGRRFNRLN